MVDQEKILQKLKYLESSLTYLRKLAALSQDEFSGDFRNVDSAIHRLQTSIEAMADIAGHIIEINEEEVYRIITHNLSDIERFIGIVAERFL